MIAFEAIQRSDNGKFVGQSGELGNMLGKFDPCLRGLNRLKRATCGGAWLGIKRIDLTGATFEKNENTGFGFTVFGPCRK